MKNANSRTDPLGSESRMRRNTNEDLHFMSVPPRPPFSEAALRGVGSPAGSDVGGITPKSFLSDGMLEVGVVMRHLRSGNPRMCKKALHVLAKQAAENPEEIEPLLRDLLQWARSGCEGNADGMLKVARIVSAVNKKCPRTGTTHFFLIVDLLENLARQEMAEGRVVGYSDERAVVGNAAILLFQAVQQTLSTDVAALEGALPMLFNLLTKDHSVRFASYGVIAPVSMSSPQLLANYVPQLFAVVRQFANLLIPLLNLYAVCPDHFVAHVDVLFDIYENESSNRAALVEIFGDMAKRQPLALEPHVTKLRTSLEGNKEAGFAVAVIREVAMRRPVSVLPLVPALCKVMPRIAKESKTIRIGLIQTMGLLARTSEDAIHDAMSLFASILKKSFTDTDAVLYKTLIPTVLLEMGRIAQPNPQILMPHVELIRRLTNEQSTPIRRSASALVQLAESHVPLPNDFDDTLESGTRITPREAAPPPPSQAQVDRRRDIVKEPPKWVPDMAAPQCFKCGATFWLLRRRHHCRHCGQVLCKACTSNSFPLPQFGAQFERPVRVCDDCYGTLCKDEMKKRNQTLPIQTMQKSGYMHDVRKKLFFTRSRRMWFVLGEQQLDAYSQARSSKRLTTVKLGDILRLSESKLGSTFALSTRKGTTVLRADSASDREQWTRAIQCNMSALAQSGLL